MINDDAALLLSVMAYEGCTAEQLEAMLIAVSIVRIMVRYENIDVETQHIMKCAEILYDISEPETIEQILVNGNFVPSHQDMITRLLTNKNSQQLEATLLREARMLAEYIAGITEENIEIEFESECARYIWECLIKDS